mmetsp:Transcript_12273/g.28429  ORF Transcript_12273/g.28429 Transcript_12273/m.28429 type:complete len:205 (+) Transcript_12273:119-733(+)
MTTASTSVELTMVEFITMELMTVELRTTESETEELDSVTFMTVELKREVPCIVALLAFTVCVTLASKPALDDCICIGSNMLEALVVTTAESSVTVWSTTTLALLLGYVTFTTTSGLLLPVVVLALGSVTLMMTIEVSFVTFTTITETSTTGTTTEFSTKQSWTYASEIVEFITFESTTTVGSKQVALFFAAEGLEIATTGNSPA